MSRFQSGTDELTFCRKYHIRALHQDASQRCAHWDYFSWRTLVRRYHTSPSDFRRDIIAYEWLDEISGWTACRLGTPREGEARRCACPAPPWWQSYAGILARSIGRVATRAPISRAGSAYSPSNTSRRIFCSWNGSANYSEVSYEDKTASRFTWIAPRWDFHWLFLFSSSCFLFSSPPWILCCPSREDLGN